MNSSPRFLRPAKAASLLGVSAKALRLYEQRGLVAPARDEAGWRSYGPDEMRRAADIVALRSLGLSLSQVAGVLGGKAEGLGFVLGAHQEVLEARIRQLSDTVDRVRHLCSSLEQGHEPTIGELTGLQDSTRTPDIEFELPWPWGGELFRLHDIRPLNYIVGPLGSGKTRLALRLAEVLPGATFLGLQRATDGGATTRLAANPALKLRVDLTLARLIEHGATSSDALIALLAGLEAEGISAVVVDLVEQGLDAATQQALATHLRSRTHGERALFVLTRSSVILDLTAVGANESIILCPANHSPPTRVAPRPGTAGYEAVATCLASPEVRARTEGVIAWHPARDERQEALPELQTADASDA